MDHESVELPLINNLLIPNLFSTYSASLSMIRSLIEFNEF